MLIGIIDSGINKEFIYQNQIQLHSAAVFQVLSENSTMQYYCFDNYDLSSANEDVYNLLQDENGHGTAVASILWSHFPQARYCIAKILDGQNEGYSDCLLEAVKWMVEVEKPEIINISLGSSDEEIRDELYQLTLKAKNQGIQIFAAASSYVSFPAVFETVFTISTLALQDQISDPKILSSINHVITNEYINYWKYGIWVDDLMQPSWACPYYVIRNYQKISSTVLSGQK